MLQVTIPASSTCYLWFAETTLLGNHGLQTLGFQMHVKLSHTLVDFRTELDFEGPRI